VEKRLSKVLNESGFGEIMEYDPLLVEDIMDA